MFNFKTKIVGVPESNEGHYLVAAKDIQAGDVILSEYPIGTYIIKILFK